MMPSQPRSPFLTASCETQKPMSTPPVNRRSDVAADQEFRRAADRTAPCSRSGYCCCLDKGHDPSFLEQPVSCKPNSDGVPPLTTVHFDRSPPTRGVGGESCGVGGINQYLCTLFTDAIGTGSPHADPAWPGFFRSRVISSRLPLTSACSASISATMARWVASGGRGFLKRRSADNDTVFCGSLPASCPYQVLAGLKQRNRKHGSIIVEGRNRCNVTLKANFPVRSTSAAMPCPVIIYWDVVTLRRSLWLRCPLIATQVERSVFCEINFTSLADI